MSFKDKKDKTALIVFAREPKDGKVKTRLAKDMGVAITTRLYKAFVKDVLQIALKVRCDQRFIYYAGHGSSIPFLRRAGKRFQLKRQMGQKLGERMYNAFVHCQKKGFDRVVIIGSDCVTLTGHLIETAFKKLEHCDCVLGPSKDGGYYLIALKSPNKNIFNDIQWSTASVLSQSLKKIRQLNMTCFLLNKKEDIDLVGNLKNLSKTIKSPNQAVYTRNILEKLTLTV